MSDPYMQAVARMVIPGQAEVPGVNICHSERASDAQRDRTVAHLRQSFELGRLTKDEFDARMGLASVAVLVTELTELLRDLPPMAAPRRRRPHLPTGHLARTWWHIGLCFAAILVMFIPSLLAWHYTGYPVVYREDHTVWTQTEHPGEVIALIFFFILTGLCGLIVNLRFWYEWATG